MTAPLPRLGRALALLAALSFFAVACGGGSDSTETSSADSSSADSSTADDDRSAPASSLFSDTDFAPVCRQTGIPGATDYTEAADGMSKLVVLEGEDPDYSFSSVSLPDGWETTYDDITETELVLCVNRVSATPTELCEGYKDDDTGTEWAVQLHDTDYEVTIREATTAEVVAEESLSAPADGCPMFSIYSEGDPSPMLDFETPDVEIEVFVRPFVTGA